MRYAPSILLHVQHFLSRHPPSILPSPHFPVHCMACPKLPVPGAHLREAGGAAMTRQWRELGFVGPIEEEGVVLRRNPDAGRAWHGGLQARRTSSVVLAADCAG